MRGINKKEAKNIGRKKNAYRKNSTKRGFQGHFFVLRAFSSSIIAYLKEKIN
jgi:hypothetical protein